MPFLPPNQQRQSTEDFYKQNGKIIAEILTLLDNCASYQKNVSDGCFVLINIT